MGGHLVCDPDTYTYIRVTDGRQKQYSVCGLSQGENLCLIFIKIGETSFRFLKNCVYLPPLMILVMITLNLLGIFILYDFQCLKI